MVGEIWSPKLKPWLKQSWLFRFLWNNSSFKFYFRVFINKTIFFTVFSLVVQIWRQEQCPGKKSSIKILSLSFSKHYTQINKYMLIDWYAYLPRLCAMTVFPNAIIQWEAVCPDRSQDRSFINIKHFYLLQICAIPLKIIHLHLEYWNYLQKATTFGETFWNQYMFWVTERL